MAILCGAAKNSLRGTGRSCHFFRPLRYCLANEFPSFRNTIQLPFLQLVRIACNQITIFMRYDYFKDFNLPVYWKITEFQLSDKHGRGLG